MVSKSSSQVAPEAKQLEFLGQCLVKCQECRSCQAGTGYYLLFAHPSSKSSNKEACQSLCLSVIFSQRPVTLTKVCGFNKEL